MDMATRFTCLMERLMQFSESQVVMVLEPWGLRTCVVRAGTMLRLPLVAMMSVFMWMDS